MEHEFIREIIAVQERPQRDFIAARVIPPRFGRSGPGVVKVERRQTYTKLQAKELRNYVYKY
jgi:hypothetical protein